MFDGRLGGPEILLLLVVVVLLFGAGAAKKLPGAAKSVGESLRIFKREMKQMREEDTDENQRAARTVAPATGSRPSAELPVRQPAADEAPREQIANR